MGRTLDRFGHFLAELQRRRVGRVAIAYAAVAFVLLQLGEIVFPVFGAPDWALRVLVVSSFLGFPPALVLAWIYDVTSEGIRRTRETKPAEAPAEAPAEGGASPGLPGGEAPVSLESPVHPAPSPSPAPGTLPAPCPTAVPRDGLLPRLALLGITGVTVAALGWWMFRDSSTREASAQDGGASSALALSDLDDASGVPEIRSLAVLPLDDFSQEEEGGEHFTAAMHEELVTQLSRVGGIRVLSRTSVVQFDRTGKTMPVVAGELGVDAVVEGSVFRAGDRVRISVQLIHGPTDRHLWAGSYEGTLDDAIALQSEVAEAIAREIQAEFFPEDAPLSGKLRLAVNPEAQESFLKGRLEQSKATPEALLAAEEHYEDAVRKDSSFAPAYAGLAATRFLMALGEGGETARTGAASAGTGAASAVTVAAPDGTGAASAGAGAAPAGRGAPLDGTGALDEAGPPSPGTPPAVGAEVVEPLRKALLLDGGSQEARAVVMALKYQLDSSEIAALPEELRAHMETRESLGSELVLTATEFGHQLQRVVVERGRGQGPDGMGPGRFAGVQRLQAAGDVAGAATILQQMIQDPKAPHQTWDALEQIKTLQGDFLGALEVRRERVARVDPSPEAEASLQRLELLLEKEGERGYWIWHLGEVEARKARGEQVSRVETARAHLALGRQEEALGNLREALEVQDRALLSLWSDPAWDPLRGDPAFQEIQARIRTPGPGQAPGRPGELFFR